MERKFILDPGGAAAAEAQLFRLPAGFRRAYPERLVSSLYFDTPDLRYLRTAVDGVGAREKVRIRFYGRQPSAGASLELKRREGSVVSKATFGPFPVDDGDENSIPARLRAACERTGIGSDAVRLPLLRRILLNRYRRRYFESADGRLRATIDAELTYCRVDGGRLRAVRFPPQPGVLEFKYAPECEERAARLLSRLPLRMQKHSKYVRGATLLRAS
jgi:hypothetical protein